MSRPSAGRDGCPRRGPGTARTCGRRQASAPIAGRVCPTPHRTTPPGHIDHEHLIGRPSARVTFGAPGARTSRRGAQWSRLVGSRRQAAPQWRSPNRRARTPQVKDPRPGDLPLDGLTTVITEGRAAAATPTLRLAIDPDRSHQVSDDAWVSGAGVRRRGRFRTLGRGQLVDLSTRVVERARASGALTPQVIAHQLAYLLEDVLWRIGRRYVVGRRAERLRDDPGSVVGPPDPSATPRRRPASRDAYVPRQPRRPRQRMCIPVRSLRRPLPAPCARDRSTAMTQPMSAGRLEFAFGAPSG